jgi:hypothetical protein
VTTPSARTSSSSPIACDVAGDTTVDDETTQSSVGLPSGDERTVPAGTVRVEERTSASEESTAAPTAEAAPAVSTEASAASEAEDATDKESLTAKRHRERAAAQLQSHPLADEFPMVIAFGKQTFKVRACIS